MTNKPSQHPISKDSVLEAVNIAEGLEYYGVSLDRHDKCLCPFHRDRHPSMKVYRDTNRFYCFVCNEGGNIIDYVMKDKRLTFQEALKRLNDDFNLGLEHEAVPVQAENEYKEEINTAAAEIEKQYQDTYDIVCKAYRVLHKEFLRTNDIKLQKSLEFLGDILDDFTGQTTRVFIR